MQITKMYAIHDSAAGAYLPPFFFHNDLLAIRAFAALINEPTHLFSQNPEDFILFRFGNFDITEGTLEIETTPVRIRAGLALVQREISPDQGELTLKQENR